MSFLAQLPLIADAWGAAMVQAAWQSAIWLAVVSLLWQVLRKRCSAHVGHALFLLPLVPLTLSSLWSAELNVPLPSAWAPMLAASPAEVTFVETVEVLPAAATRLPSALPQEGNLASPPSSLNHGPENVAPAQTPFTWVTWAFLSWLLLVSTFLFVFFREQLRGWKQVQAANPFPAAEERRIQNALARLDAPQNIPVLQCEQLASPAAWGLFRRRILMPSGFLADLSDEQLTWILGHELAHHKRLDLGVSFFQRVLQILWFFHPLMWWHGVRLERIRECACDESAMARTQTRGEACARTLVQVASRALPPKKSRITFQHLFSEKKTMKLRIQRLMDGKRSPQAGMTPVAALLLSVATLFSAITLRPQHDNAATPTPLSQAQVWLLGQQRPDGHWPAGPGLEKATGEFNAVGITGLVLMALEQSDPVLVPQKRVDQATSKGLAFLKTPLENPLAFYQEKSNWRALASHSIALEAWLRGHRNASNDTWKATAQLAINALIEARNPYGGWGYEFTPNGDQASYYTCFALRSLHLAKRLGFEIPRDTFYGGRSALQSFTDKETGRTSFDTSLEGDVRLIEKKESHPTSFTELGTALTIVTLADLGDNLPGTPRLMRGVGLLSAKPPSVSESHASVDYYYWCYGSLAMNHVGGVAQESWNNSLAEALLPLQSQSGKEAGSFPAIDAWSLPGATVHATAMAALALRATQG